MYAIARLRKPRGLRGEIWADILCDDFDDFVEIIEASALWFSPREPRLGQSAEGLEPVEIEQIRPHKGAALLTFPDIKSCEDAEALRGYFIVVRREDLPELGDGVFYYFQLTGLEVVEAGGKVLGKVIEIDDNPAHPLLVVEPADGSRPFRIPYARVFVESVDLDAATITITLPNGFIESQF
jgi:16S rRNA processing protein RimM